MRCGYLRFGSIALPQLVYRKHGFGHLGVNFHYPLRGFVLLAQAGIKIGNRGHAFKRASQNHKTPGQCHVQLADLLWRKALGGSIAVDGVQKAVRIEGVQPAQHGGVKGIAQQGFAPALAVSDIGKLCTVALIERLHTNVQRAALRARLEPGHNKGRQIFHKFHADVAVFRHLLGHLRPVLLRIHPGRR